MAGALFSAAVVMFAATPSGADAHGPTAPIASSYVARVSHVPPGIEAKVVDGDLRMWLHVSPTETVVVLDLRGAPYLRFSRAGVDVNHNSAMYYLNQTPVATPPSNLTAQTPPSWHRVSGGNEYGWHDGRLHALATVALLPGASFVGTWSVPLLVDGLLAPISGGLWHAQNPSIVWFWPIVVLLLCVLAASRVRSNQVDVRVARGLGVGALVAITVAAVGRDLHGRPNVSTFQLIELALILAYVAWGAIRVMFSRPTYVTCFVIALVAMWEGIELIPTVLHGFVLAAVPAFVARASAVVCLGCGVGLLLMTFRLAVRTESARWALAEGTS
jgi:hypothetical protein